MTEDGFRAVALSLPEAIESAHMGTPDFRVRGRIFATLREGRGVLKLTRAQQEMLCEAEPAMFAPVAGGWGRQGWTRLEFAQADEATLRSALTMAWRNVAPKRLAAAFDALAKL